MHVIYYPDGTNLHPPQTQDVIKKHYLRGPESEAFPAILITLLFFFFFFRLKLILPPPKRTALLFLPINRAICIYPPGGIAPRIGAIAIQSIGESWSKTGKEAAERFPPGRNAKHWREATIIVIEGNETEAPAPALLNIIQYRVRHT